MALSPRSWVALVALVALVTPRGARGARARVCPQLQGDPSDPGTIAVTNGGTRGTWGDPEFCPPGSVATGFQLKVEDMQGVLRDDTALNGVRLLCDTGTDTVTSSVGPFGYWDPTVTCPQGQHLSSFRLRVESPWSLWDYTAANNLGTRCSGGTELLATGSDWGNWGTWGDWSPSCPSSCGVCGISTRVDPSEGGPDDSGLNDVKFYCCSTQEEA